MIRAYTTNDSHAKTITQAAGKKEFEVELYKVLDIHELEAALPELSILIFDLTAAAFSAETVMRTLDSYDSDAIPPVLYLLSGPADIELIAEAGSIVNQDYSFVPVDPANLAARLEVLNMLGARRKLSLETAITDRLTGLANRKYFIRRLEEELYRAVRYKYSTGILMVDIDFFAKEGELQEQSNNEVIKSVAEFFRDRLRQTDMIARYKWDDFALLLPDISPEDSLAVAKDIKAKLDGLELNAAGTDVALKAAVAHLSFPSEGIINAIDVIGRLEDGCLEAKSNDSVISV